MPFLAQIGFLAHFCHFDTVTFFWFGHKTKSDFHQRITSYLQGNVFRWPEKLPTVLPQNYFGKFCYWGPPWGIFIHGYSESLGGSLSSCGVLLLQSWHFIQIHSETLWTIFMQPDFVTFIHSKGEKMVYGFFPEWLKKSCRHYWFHVFPSFAYWQVDAT